MRHALTITAVIALAAACASPGMPPGGPTVSAFPRVIVTLPDSNAVNVRPNKVLVRYDDVIAEQANGGDLSKSVLISPWDGEPRVEWRRTGMTIRPHGLWRTNTAYTITILPGIGDLKNRPIPGGYVLRFSTGPTIPKTAIRGVAFDWVGGRALPKATIQAIDAKDSTLFFITVADSTGRYELTTVPPGEYLVRAIDEKSANRILEPREPWDTVRVTLADSARADLYMYVHDTLPVRISEIRLSDSATIALVLDKPLKPGVAIPASVARVVTTDSTVLGVVSVLTALEEQAERARADSIARSKDTTARAAEPAGPPRRTIDPTRRRDTVPTLPPPEMKRVKPTTELVIKMAAPVKPGATYRVTLTGLRNLLNIEGTTTRLLIVPKPTPPDSTKGPGAPGARNPRDSTVRPIPPKVP